MKTVAMVPVDPLRAGGMASLRRHNFVGQAPDPEPTLASEADVSPEERAAIREAASAFLDAANAAMVGAVDDATDALDLSNEDFDGWPSRADALGQALKEARAVSDAVRGFVSGAAAPYLRNEELDVAREVSDAAADLEAAAEAAPFRARDPIDPARSVRDLESRISPLGDLSAAVDRLVVAAEAPSVPVREPGEGDPGLLPLVGLGLMATAAWLLYEYLS